MAVTVYVLYYDYDYDYHYVLWRICVANGSLFICDRGLHLNGTLLAKYYIHKYYILQIDVVVAVVVFGFFNFHPFLHLVGFT